MKITKRQLRRLIKEEILNKNAQSVIAEAFEGRRSSVRDRMFDMMDEEIQAEIDELDPITHRSFINSLEESLDSERNIWGFIKRAKVLFSPTMGGTEVFPKV